jgi:hypothetical protein
MDSSSVMRPSTRSYLASTEPLFCIFEPRRSDSSRVMRNLDEEYMDSREQRFIILAAWKCDSCRVVKSSTPWATSFISGSVRHFGHLEMWFFKFMRTSNHSILLSLGYCTAFSSRSLRPSAEGYVATSGPLFYILVASKCDSWRVERLSAQVYMVSCESLFSILAA